MSDSPLESRRLEFRAHFLFADGCGGAGVFVCDEDGEALRPLTEEDQDRLEWCESDPEVWFGHVERVDVDAERRNCERKRKWMSDLHAGLHGGNSPRLVLERELF